MNPRIGITNSASLVKDAEATARFFLEFALFEEDDAAKVLSIMSNPHELMELDKRLTAALGGFLDEQA